MKHTPREHQRVYLTFYLRVFAGRTFIGFLIDISQEGLMLMSESPMKKNKEYSLTVLLPSSLKWEGKKEDENSVDFKALCKWSKQDEIEKDFYLSGYIFTEINQKNQHIIHNIIQEYKL